LYSTGRVFLDEELVGFDESYHSNFSAAEETCIQGLHNIGCLLARGIASPETHIACPIEKRNKSFTQLAFCMTWKVQAIVGIVIFAEASS
jgi:hypothetical protein